MLPCAGISATDVDCPSTHIHTRLHPPVFVSVIAPVCRYGVACVYAESISLSPIEHDFDLGYLTQSASIPLHPSGYCLVLPVLGTGTEFQFPVPAAVDVLLEGLLGFCAANEHSTFRLFIVVADEVVNTQCHTYRCIVHEVIPVVSTASHGVDWMLV